MSAEDDRLAAIGRLVEAARAHTRAEAEADKARQARDQAILEARRAGLTLDDIAEYVGLTKGRAHQITNRPGSADRQV